MSNASIQNLGCFVCQRWTGFTCYTVTTLLSRAKYNSFEERLNDAIRKPRETWRMLCDLGNNGLSNK